MSHERNEESGCWTGWGPTRFLGRHEVAKFPVGSSQIDWKETSIKRLEAKVNELRRLNEDAYREVSRKAWTIRKLEEKVAKLNQQVKVQSRRSAWRGRESDTTAVDLSQLLQVKVSEMEEAARHKEEEIRVLEVKVVELSQRVREAGIEQPDYAVTNFNRLLPEGIVSSFTMEDAPRKEKETKGRDPKIAERLPRETEDSGQKERHIEHLKQKIARLAVDARGLDQEYCSLWATTQKQRDEINQLKALVKTASEQRNNPPSQALVRKADSISAVEVADLVRMLNAQIEFVSALIVDTLEPSGSREGSAALNDLRDYLGPWLFNDLSRRSNEPEMESDPLIIQITLQTVLVHACSRIINHWNPPFWDDGSIFFRVYSNMGGVGHIIAGTWSAVAHAMSQSKVREANVKHLSETVVKAIAAVGGSPPSGKSLPPEYKEKIEEKIEDIAKQALDLHQLVTKDVTSMDFVTYTVPSDTKFDPTQMEDTEGSAESVPQDRVICTLEMGLQYRKRPELGEQHGVTLKPKVVLSATLEE